MELSIYWRSLIVPVRRGAPGILLINGCISNGPIMWVIIHDINFLPAFDSHLPDHGTLHLLKPRMRSMHGASQDKEDQLKKTRYKGTISLYFFLSISISISQSKCGYSLCLRLLLSAPWPRTSFMRSVTLFRQDGRKASVWRGICSFHYASLWPSKIYMN